MPFDQIHDCLILDKEGNIIHKDGLDLRTYLLDRGLRPGDHINVVKHEELMVVNGQAKQGTWNWCA